MGGGDEYYGELQKRLDAAMPWVGLYIAGASAVCTLAMAADLFNGFRLKKLWFPCNYFSLNATSLTLLAVAMKLPVDLTTIMIKSGPDGFAKYMSLIFMSTAQANFMSSLGSMNDNEVLANVVALGILVITIMGNVWIQLIELWHFLSLGTIIVIIMVPTTLMLLSLLTLVSLAITVPTSKRCLESKYQEKHREALGEEEALNRREEFRVDDRKIIMMKYLVMAETSSPQFVIARSVVSSSSAVICLFASIILAGFQILIGIERSDRGASPYGDYTRWILYVQSIGVAVGIIAPILRWFVVVSFWCSTTNWNSFWEGFKIEAHWVQTLVEWRDNFSPLRIPQNQSRKYLHDVKWFTITFCIGVQSLIVFESKLIVFLSALLVSPFFLCFTHIINFKRQTGNEGGGEHLSRYVLLLEGEPKLPRRFVKNICREADNIIDTGRRKQPWSLLQLLEKSQNFIGVGEFDSNRIPTRDQEPPNCWTLPVVTLTSIAIALPNIENHRSKLLLSQVTEGLSLAKLVEKTLVQNVQLVNIRKAADVAWVQVVLYSKWLHIDLKATFDGCGNYIEVLQQLSDEAREVVTQFEEDVQEGTPLKWPAEVVAANSMYRISETILLSIGGENQPTDEELFGRLSVMIADIFAACLTNLPHVITAMCHHNAIEKRDKSVREAFLLLGKTEQIVALLHPRINERPHLRHDEAATIEGWRASFRRGIHDPAAMPSSSNDE